MLETSARLLRLLSRLQVRRDGAGALAKLEQVLPVRLRPRVNALRAATVSVPPDIRGPTVEPETLTAVAAACRDHDRPRFDHQNHGGDESSRSELVASIRALAARYDRATKAVRSRELDTGD